MTAIQRTIGSYNFVALYQQQQVPERGNLDKWKWLQLYEPPPYYSAILSEVLPHTCETF